MYGSTQPTSSPRGKRPRCGHCPVFAREKNAEYTICSDDSGRRARRKCDGAGAGCRLCVAFGTQGHSRRARCGNHRARGQGFYGAATRCTATASKSRAASTAFKRSKKPAAGELRASWCRPSRPLRRCPRNICLNGGKPKSSEPARAGCARDLRSCQATLARIVQSLVRHSIMDRRVMRGW